jgi:NADH:ubiquinone oxidoreductase subunit 6 (subunit J)
MGLISVVLNIVILCILLEAEYLALIFVAVYLGAVTVLFLFIVMMLNLKSKDYSKEIIYSLPIAFFLGGLVFYFLYMSVANQVGVNNSIVWAFTEGIFIDWYSIQEQVSNINVFGSILYMDYAPYLLIVGIILLIAMIGAIILTKTNYVLSDKKRDFIDQQVTRNPQNAVFFINERKKRKGFLKSVQTLLFGLASASGSLQLRTVYTSVGLVFL